MFYTNLKRVSKFFSINNFLVNSITIRYFKFSGMKIGSKTSIGNINMFWPHKIKIGNNCNLESGTIFKNFNLLEFEGFTISIGDNNFIGEQCYFNIASKITIGSNCLIAARCTFIDHDHGMIKNQLIRDQIGSKKEISIDDDVWIGANVIILKGVHIGKGAVIAAGAVVAKSIPDYEIWGGVPAKKISERI